jgi:hypothetical protein
MLYPAELRARVSLLMSGSQARRPFIEGSGKVAKERSS